MNVLAFDLGGHHLRGARIDENGKILEQKSVGTADGRDPNAVLGQIASMAEALIQGAGRSDKIVGAGLGIPGFMDVDTGLVYSSPNFPVWTNFRLTEALKKKISIPFRLENDANCATLGEWWMGAGRGTRFAIGFTLGTGVGGGIIVDGVLIRGSHGTGGEVGHMVLEAEGPLCGCGGRGCLEALISGDHIEKETGTSPEAWSALASKGDRNALKIFEKMGTHLGTAASSLCQLFDPEVIVMGGQISRAFSFFYPKMRVELDRRLAKHPAKSVRVVPAELGDDAGLLGAAYTAIKTHSQAQA